MNSNEYQVKTVRFRPNFETKEDMISHAVLGLNSEAGELAGIFQKKYQGHEIDELHVKKEMGDCLWFLAELMDAFDTSFDEVMAINIQKLNARFPEGFDPERSLHRKAGDI